MNLSPVCLSYVQTSDFGELLKALPGLRGTGHSARIAIGLQSLANRSYLATSRQFGRTSAPLVPHFVHTMRGPFGTGSR
jgi:hypothetical protein